MSEVVITLETTETKRRLKTKTSVYLSCSGSPLCLLSVLQSADSNTYLKRGWGGVSGLLTRLYLLRCDILAKPRTKPEKEALNKES